MKALVPHPAILALLAFFFASGMTQAQDNPESQDVSFQAFYDQLGDQGTWIQTDTYGYVFQPNVSDPNWAPYTDGHWVSTDQGWTWVSSEPWGWATYHYGRWANIDGIGWVWVPGYRWAPAWVSWRYGGGYCGWAPLPPETLEGADDGDQGYHFGNDVDVSFNIGAGCYSFLPVGDMGDPNYRGRFANRGNNYVIINRTTNVTNININNNSGTGNAAGYFRGVTTGGPSLRTVNAHSKQHIQTVQLTQAGKPGIGVLQGKSLAIFAPRVARAAGQQAKPAQVSQTISHPTFNRGTTITKPLDVTARVKSPAPTPQAIENARQADEKTPATAKIARDTAPGKTTLTSLAPETPQKKSAPPDVKPANSSELNSNSVDSHVQQRSTEAPPTGDPAKPAVRTQSNEVHPQPQETVHPQAQPQEEVHPQHQEQPQEHQQQPQPQTQTHQAPPQSHPPAQAEQKAPPKPAANNSTNPGAGH
jgi:hypothetical protein